MSIYKQFKTSKAHEEEGIVVRFKANDDKTIPSFKIGRACRSNVKWAKTFEAKTRPFKEDIDNKSISEEVANKLNIEVFVDSLLQGWENIQRPDGKPLVYNRENAIKLFMDLPELYETLNAKASDVANFLEANIKEYEKN